MWKSTTGKGTTYSRANSASKNYPALALRGYGEESDTQPS